MHVTVTKISNGYLVTTIGDDGIAIDSKAVVKTAVGNVPVKSVGMAITAALGKITVAKKAVKTRKPRKAKEVPPEAASAVAS